MIKQSIKQALGMLKENPLVSTISIAGSALSIAMILVMVLVFQINLSGYPPESHRDRMLYISGMHAKAMSETMPSNNGRLSQEIVKECFYTLQKPEAVTAFTSNEQTISLPDKKLYTSYKIKYTDAGFWEVCDFTFAKGAPFTEADFQSAIPRAVISDKLARKLYGTIDVLGRTFILNYQTFTICGVVKEVSTAATTAYAEAWIPYTTSAVGMEAYCENMAGSLQTILLAHSSSDFEAIRDELSRQISRYNTGKTDYQADLKHYPITRLDIAISQNYFQLVSWKEYLLDTGSLLLFLLLVPALNLTGIIQASIQKRSGEVGLRKAFGATRNVLIRQIVWENLVVTVIGGAIGLLLSIGLLYLGKSFMLDNPTLLTASMLFRPGLFLAAFVFVLLLNLLSAGLPAFRIAGKPIVDALNDSE